MRLTASTIDAGRNVLLDVAFAVRRRVANLTWLRAATLILLACGAWLQFVELPKARVATEAADERARKVAFEKERERSRPKPKDPERILWEQLEPQARFRDVVADLNRLSREGGLSILNTTIGDADLKSLATIGHLDLSVRAQGNYVAIKSTIGQLLERYPGLALDQWTMEKVEADKPRLNTSMKFVFYFRR